jgi:hypothetical protein
VPSEEEEEEKKKKKKKKTKNGWMNGWMEALSDEIFNRNGKSYKLFVLVSKSIFTTG